MADFALDESRDADFNTETKNFNSVEDYDENLKQGILVFLNTNKGELPWNEDFGIDHNQVLLDINEPSALDQELDEWITTEFEGDVESVSVTDVVHDGRRATIQLTIQTTGGQEIQLDQEEEDDDDGTE